MNVELRIIGSLLVLATSAAAEMRIWTFEKSGKTLEAEVAGFTDDSVTLKDVGGKTVSVRIAYLSKSDRAYLAMEKAKQWTEVEVLKLDASTAIGRYRKCVARGTGVNGEIYIERLPVPVLTVLQDRNRQAAPIAQLSSQIESRKRAVQEAKSAVPTKGGGAYGQRRAAAAQRSQLNVETSDINGLEVNLARLQKAYDESVQKTKHQTVVRMRNTGIIYQGLPLWQCVEPRKPQP